MLGSIVLLGLICYFLYYHMVQKRQGLPPGPIPLPIIGNIFQLDPKAPNKTIAEWAKKYGPVMTIWIGTEANVFVTDYKLMKECFMKGDTYSGRPAHYVLRLIVGGAYGIVMSDGPFWKEQRRFSLHVLRDFGFGRNVMEERVNAQADKLIQQVSEMLEDKPRLINLTHPLELCVGNIINSIVFGYAFKKGDPTLLRLKAHMDSQIELMAEPRVLLLSSYPFLRYVPLFGNFGYNELNKRKHALWDFADEQVADCLKNFLESSESSDFVTSYYQELARREKSGELNSFSKWQLKMAILDIWGAGLETTVTTLKWGILLMMHYPIVQAKCALEIKNLLDGRESKVITMADRNSLPYTAATVNEIQRRANLLPINIQHSTTEDTMIEGYHIKRGTIVVPQISAVLFDSNIFPQPEKFLPERFLESDGKTLKKVEEFIPFSLGKRSCMGESLAKMELFLIFVALIRHFQFSGALGRPLPSLEAAPGFVRTPQKYSTWVEKRGEALL